MKKLVSALVEALESFEEYRKEKISGNKKLVYFEKLDKLNIAKIKVLKIEEI